MIVRVGETYGKRKDSDGFVLYTVLRVTGETITLQNLDHPEHAFDTTASKLELGGYELVSQAPYIPPTPAKKRALRRRPSRCPHTVDFIEGRADCEKPALRSGDIHH